MRRTSRDYLSVLTLDQQEHFNSRRPNCTRVNSFDPDAPHSPLISCNLPAFSGTTEQFRKDILGCDGDSSRAITKTREFINITLRQEKRNNRNLCPCDEEKCGVCDCDTAIKCEICEAAPLPQDELKFYTYEVSDDKYHFMIKSFCCDGHRQQWLKENKPLAARGVIG
jgi:hypothetical protein